MCSLPLIKIVRPDENVAEEINMESRKNKKKIYEIKQELIENECSSYYLTQ